MLIDALCNKFQNALLSFLKRNMANYCIYIFSRNYPLNDIQLDECRKQVFGSKQSFPHTLFITQFLFPILYTSTDISTEKIYLLCCITRASCQVAKNYATHCLGNSSHVWLSEPTQAINLYPSAMPTTW